MIKLTKTIKFPSSDKISLYNLFELNKYSFVCKKNPDSIVFWTIGSCINGMLLVKLNWQINWFTLGSQSDSKLSNCPLLQGVLIKHDCFVSKKAQPSWSLPITPLFEGSFEHQL